MYKSVSEIYQSLKEKGFKDEMLLQKLLEVGEIIIKQAKAEAKRELVDLGVEILKDTADLARKQKLFSLSAAAGKLYSKHNKLKITIKESSPAKEPRNATENY